MATMTAQQKRDVERRAYDAYLRECPSHQLVGMISDKWVVLTLSALGRGPRRHSELRRAIPSVSQKMLTQTLRTLERDGFVERTVTPSVPVRVDYELTSLGRDFLPLVVALKAWAEDNIDRVNLARESYDGAV